MKQIVVHCEREFTQVALLENEELIEYALESPQEVQLAGSVYLGKVVNVLPGMQAAFVDIGQAKNAFLYIDDILPANLERHPKIKPPIDQLVDVNQTLMVQVVKEPVGTKGARVTTHFSLPGRALVYMPTADYVGVSRKIEDEEERTRLKEIAEQLRQEGEGIIIRTAADGTSPEAVEADLLDLRELWQAITETRDGGQVPRRLYHDVGVLPRLVRDLFTDDVDELLIDNANKAGEIVQMLEQMAPHLAGRVKRYKGQRPIQDHFGILEQLNKLFRPKVWLANGGYLWLDQTEALTVIDVNTGKYTGSVDLEETVFQTNLEAAERIGKLLRLRDLGGIIIVDFIDMKQEEHRQEVIDRLQQVIMKDRTKTLVVGWTRLGLLELTRKKVRNTKDRLFFETCPTCKGTGLTHNGKRLPGFSS